MIKNIVFDIGNVLLEFKPKEYFSVLFDEDKVSEKVCNLMMNSSIWKAYDLGTFHLEDVKKEFKKELPQYEKEIEQMLSMWVYILKPITYTLNQLKKLKKEGYKIYLLSNLNEDAYYYIKEEYAIFDDAHGYVLSFQEGLSKPNKRIYESLMDKYSLTYKECLFIDDLYENVEMAIHCGMKGIHFKDIEQVDKELNDILESNIIC